MLDWERWTLTHSSGDPVALGFGLGLVLALVLGLGLGLGLVLALVLLLGLGLGLALVLSFGLGLVLLLGFVLALVPVLLLGLGLVAVWALSVVAIAPPVAVDIPDTDGEGDVDPDDPGSFDGDGRGERDGDGEPDDREGEGEADVSGVGETLAEGDAAVDGSLVAGDGLAGGLMEDEGDGEGEREGDGFGVGAVETGSAWHTVSVLAVVATGVAWALPSRPRVRKLPLSKVTAAALTCAKRIRSPVYAARQGCRVLFGIRRRLGDGWVCLLISAEGLHMHHPSSASQAARPRPTVNLICLSASVPV
jgi:hypothetical protein